MNNYVLPMYTISNANTRSGSHNYFKLFNFSVDSFEYLKLNWQFVLCISASKVDTIDTFLCLQIKVYLFTR